MIVVVITARPSYARVKSVLTALQQRGVELGVVVCASALLERYGSVVNVIKKDGFPVLEELYSVYEGSTLETSAKETGALLEACAYTFAKLRPSCVVVIADRHEVLGVAQAASYQNLPIAHLQGGERSGSIDNKCRDAITALADYHFVATEAAKYRVYGLTGSSHIYQVGCPSIDLAAAALKQPPVTLEELGGRGADISPQHGFLLILQHPVTNEAEQAGQQMKMTLDATAAIPLPRIVMWPGEDAGHDEASKAIRLYMDQYPDRSIRTVRNLPPERFLRLLFQSKLLVGNSSVGIRECSYLGVPVVDIGIRQWGRERGQNVINVRKWDVDAITHACWTQRQRTYTSNTLYGDGTAGVQIAEVLCHILH